MALQFSDTSAYNGIVQAAERLVYSSDYGRISGNTKELAQWTVRFNQALGRATALMSQYAGSWRIGDWNHASYDTATQNITSGTRSYALSSPENVLFIFKVLIKEDANTADYTEIKPMDIRQQGTTQFVEDNADNVGIPYRYEKVGGYITLDPEPNYSATNGLKYYYQRAPHPFVVGDTTAISGIPGIFDQLIPYYAVDMYATENTNATLKQMIAVDIARMEEDIKAFLRMRSESDQPAMLRPVKRSSR